MNHFVLMLSTSCNNIRSSIERKRGEAADKFFIFTIRDDKSDEEFFGAFSILNAVLFLKMVYKSHDGARTSQIELN